MDVIEKVVSLVIGVIVICLIAYVGFQIFIAMVVALWNLNPLTAVGFVISIIIAIWKGHISFEKLEDNLAILVFIFGGTLISYAATSMIPSVLDFAFTGNIIGTLIISVVVLVIWIRGNEIRNINPR